MTHDLRFGGRWSATQRMKNDAVYAALRGLDASLRHVPLDWTGHALGWIAQAVVGRSTVARDNVARVFPSWTAAQRTQLLSRHAERLAVHARDALAVTWGRRASSPLSWLGNSRAVLDEALAGGRGVVLASAHLGAWERVAHTLVSARVPFSAVTREPYDPRLARWLGALRRDVPTIPRGGTRAMLRGLRAGRVLGIPMDLATRGVDTTTTTFLGQPTAMVTGPARLALRTGAAVVLATYTRSGETEGLSIQRVPLAPRDDDPRGRIVDLTGALADGLTEAILQCPEEWLWLHPRWPRSGSTPLYSPHDAWEASRT